MRHADVPGECSLVGGMSEVDCHGQKDEIDPHDMVREKPPNAMPAFGDSGLGGLRGNKESLQIFSLQGQHSLEFRATGYAFCVRKTKHRRWQSA